MSSNWNNNRFASKKDGFFNNSSWNNKTTNLNKQSGKVSKPVHSRLGVKVNTFFDRNKQIKNKNFLAKYILATNKSNSTIGGITINQKESGNLKKKLTWFKVTIHYGNSYPRDFILQSIADLISPNTFVPLKYTVADKQAYFYLDNEEDTCLVEKCSNKIVASDGFRLRISTVPQYPKVEPEDLNDVFKNRLKNVLEKRFIEAINTLDLSNFHRDPEMAIDYFCTLFQPAIMDIVFELATEYIPNVASINFNDNSLANIQKLSELKNKFPNLKILHLGNNKIKEFCQLDVIKELDLQELVLIGNPLYKKYKTRQNDYICELQRRFPSLQRLDGKNINRSITFDIQQEHIISLPSSKLIFAINEESKIIAASFLLEYFRIFDSNNRENLMNAYHEHATLSTSAWCQNQSYKLDNYLHESRNLLRITDVNRRYKLLKTGKLHVMSHIVGLPKSQHIDQSFTMDVCLVTNEMILVIVTGLFKELDSDDSTLKYFHRTFIIIREGQGYCICNEQLHVTLASLEQEKKYRPSVKSRIGVPNSTVVQQIPLTQIPLQEPSVNEMQNMITVLSNRTNMNYEWSLKCLQECKWDFDHAFASFQNCFQNGQLPNEAFIK